MSKPLPATDCEQMGFGWTASAAASLARISALQDVVRDLLGDAPACGGNTPGSLTKRSQNGSSSKTSPSFGLVDWTLCSGRSLRSGMMLSGTLFPLPPLALRTLESGSGLLPTPRAEGHDAMGSDLSKSLLGAAKLWPTPVRPNGGRVLPKGTTITGNTAITASGRKAQIDLRNAVNLERTHWPTPHGMADGHGSELSQAVRVAEGLSDSERSAKRVPTPQARDYRTGTANRWSNPEKSRNLNDWLAAQMVPTPTARDWKSGKHATQEERGRSAGPPLSEMAGGQLNPPWVEWLMGYPIGWTDLRLSATQLSHKSPS